MKPASVEQAVFAQALLYDAPEARASYLEAACGSDPALRRRVEALLRAAQNAGDFLEKPADGLAETPGALLEVELLEKRGDRIGRYQLLEKIGEGGCGVVYMAEQEEPVRRRVALKILKPGMDSKAVIARFEAERQALALMDHPSIARVLDGGATQTGRPYFVMELVRGVRITDFCEQAGLSTEARLRLFMQVCHALQHAHQKGIIHRDLKPSNILVTVNDGAAVPKVIDFGIAKATGQRLTDKTLFTQFHSFMGTPAYTSPEQAEMSSVDVDTRSDIYSLGVLLYELLTGKTPFDAKELLSAGLDQMRRIIREVEPVRPSKVERTGMRRLNSPALVPELKSFSNDLDWIVMRCLDKDRARRYPTASDLAADIQRHLNDEPIAARPPTAAYRFQKMVRRNRVVFLAATAIVIALLAGAVLSASQAIRARRAQQEQSRLRRLAESGNLALRDTVSVLELERAEELFRSGDPGLGVAHLAATLRHDPSNHIAAARLLSALVHRNWALPTGPPLGHLGQLSTVCFSPDGRRLLTGSWDKTARVWDALSGEPLLAVHHQNHVLAARYDRSGGRFVTASADGMAQVWDATNGSPITPPLKHEGKVHYAEFSPDDRTVLTASADRTARLWDAQTGAPQHTFRGHLSQIYCARFSPDGQRVATGSASGGVRVWHAQSGEELFQRSEHRGRIHALCFSPDGSTLASASEDGTGRIWSAATGRLIATLAPHAGSVRDHYEIIMHHLAFSPDGQLLLTTSQDGTARLWRATNGFPVGEPFRHGGGIVHGEFSPDNQTLATTALDITARLWDIRTAAPLGQPLREYETIIRTCFSPDGQRLVTASLAWKAQIWNVPRRPSPTVEMRHARRATSSSFSPRGDIVFTTCEDQTARLWDARSGNPRGEPMLHESAVLAGAFSPDGQRVVTATRGGTARLWDAKTGQSLGEPMPHAKVVAATGFSPDGQHLFTVSADRTARVWDGQTGRPVTAPLPHAAGVLGASFSPDGRLLVTASRDNGAHLWNAGTGDRVGEPLTHLDHVLWAEFSPDGSRVITASSDNHACIWDARTSRAVAPRLQHVRSVAQARFAPDGLRVATASLDLTARIWDARTGQALTPPLRHESPVFRVSFSPDGRRILTGSWNGAARIWDVQTGRPLTEWLQNEGHLFDARLDATGTRVLSAGATGLVRLWDAPPAPTPVPAWLIDLAEAVAGIRLSARGNVELVPREQIQALSQQGKQSRAGDFYGSVAGWFFAHPADRPSSPFQVPQR